MEESIDRRYIALAVFALIAVGVVTAILISRSGGSGGSSSAASAAGCRQVEAPPPKHVSLSAPKQTVKKGEKLTAVVKTSCGSFDIALDTERAPKTANSFAYLAEKGFYDNLTFHRIVPGFVIQAGDPTQSGAGGPGYLTLDVPPRSATYRLGTVAMAKTALEPAGTSGSQFFVVTAADAGLPPDYALLGHVTSGLAVVERIGRLGQASGMPVRTVLIRRIRVAAQ